MDPSLTRSTGASQYVQVEIEVKRSRNAQSFADWPIIVENDESSDTSSDEEAEDSTANPSDSSAERCCIFLSTNNPVPTSVNSRDSDLKRLAMRPRAYD